MGTPSTRRCGLRHARATRHAAYVRRRRLDVVTAAEATVAIVVAVVAAAHSARRGRRLLKRRGGAVCVLLHRLRIVALDLVSRLARRVAERRVREPVGRRS